jgi:hypothetical protein
MSINSALLFITLGLGLFCCDGNNRVKKENDFKCNQLTINTYSKNSNAEVKNMIKKECSKIKAAAHRVLRLLRASTSQRGNCTGLCSLPRA